MCDSFTSTSFTVSTGSKQPCNDFAVKIFMIHLQNLADRIEDLSGHFEELCQRAQRNREAVYTYHDEYLFQFRKPAPKGSSGKLQLKHCRGSASFRGYNMIACGLSHFWTMLTKLLLHRRNIFLRSYACPSIRQCPTQFLAAGRDLQACEQT